MIYNYTTKTFEDRLGLITMYTVISRVTTNGFLKKYNKIIMEIEWNKMLK
jgi:hypothetical protein